MNEGSREIDWQSIRGVIFDIDGTLYRQTPVRLRLAFKLLLHVLINKNGWNDLLVLRHYRKNREILAKTRSPNVSRVHFRATSRAFQISEEQVARIIHKWIDLKPLPFLKAARYADIERIFKVLRGRGIKIGVFSDFPIGGKLVALGLDADAACCSTDEDVNRFKPEPAGLLRIIELLGLARNECLMIGNRGDRDGLCAKSVSMAFLLCKGRRFYTRLLSDVNRSWATSSKTGQ